MYVYNYSTSSCTDRENPKVNYKLFLIKVSRWCFSTPDSVSYAYYELVTTRVVGVSDSTVMCKKYKMDSNRFTELGI